jgi:ABC-type sugar transport system ATPase subunit/ribose/xylose/arabinose/galactoside ABC-type transport system permease subunit
LSETALANLQGIEKSYPGVHALKGVDFTIRGGQIHCLVGENGAGKSTLMRILSGAERPDAGAIDIEGRSFSALDPTVGLALGVGVIYQELDLVPDLSVAENIFLGHEPHWRFGIVNRDVMQKRARGLLDHFDHHIDPLEQVRNLGPAEQQLVQIARTLSREGIRILVLDEPTAALTPHEVERLFQLLGRFRERGLGLVYISHRLEEVRRIGDQVTVLRDGEVVLTAALADVSGSAIITAMVGRALADTASRLPVAPLDIALAVEGLSRKGGFEDISFTVRGGEVLALAGLIGAGRTEVLETIFGVHRPDHGRILIGGQPVALNSTSVAIQLGVGLVPEDRRESGLVLGRSILDNLIYPILNRISSILRLDHRRAAAIAADYIRDLQIRTPSAWLNVGRLSGGNQQKVVVGKWLAANTKILLLDEPTRGVDVNAKAEIHRLIADLASGGAAIIVASSELPEVLAISDRILVLAQGRQAALLETAKTNQIEVMQYAVSGGTLSNPLNLSATVTNHPPLGAPMTRPREGQNARFWAGVRGFFFQVRIITLLLILVVTASFASPVFLTPLNIKNVLSQCSLIGVLALAQYLVVLIGGFDLSVAAIMALGSVLVAWIAPHSVNLAVLAALGTGAGLGFVSGLAITVGRVPPLIATLGVMGIARGLAFAVTEKSILVPAKILAPFQVSFGVFGGPTIVWIVLTLLLGWCLARMRLGRHLYAIGGNERTARLAGIEVDRLKLFIYALAGGLSGLGGIGLVIRSSSGVPHAGANWELDTIAAIVIGGTRLFGGEGSIVNAMMGVLIYQMIGNIMNLVSLNPYYQDIVKAAVIIIVVGTSVTRTRRRRVRS